MKRSFHKLAHSLKGLVPGYVMYGMALATINNYQSYKLEEIVMPKYPSQKRQHYIETVAMPLAGLWFEYMAVLNLSNFFDGTNVAELAVIGTSYAALRLVLGYVSYYAKVHSGQRLETAVEEFYWDRGKKEITNLPAIYSL